MTINFFVFNNEKKRSDNVLAKLANYYINTIFEFLNLLKPVFHIELIICLIEYV